MVATPKQREELSHWEYELIKYEIMVSKSTNTFELEQNIHMVSYITNRILKLENQIYNKTS